MTKLLYALALLVVGYASVFLDSMSIRAFLVVLILLPFVLYGIVRYQKKRLTAKLFLDLPFARKRTPFTVQIIADNISKIPISRLDIQLSFENEFAPETGKVKLHGMADNEAVSRINYTITSEFCGRLSIKPVSFRIYDILGLTFCRITDVDSLSVLIMPEIYDMDVQVRESTRAFPVDSEEFDPHRSGDDVSEVFDFREYQGGDRPNRIHWKLSMKSEDLIVKEFSHPIGYSVVLLLDLAAKDTNIPHIKRMDGFIETAASLSHSMLNVSCFHYISWYSVKQGALIRRSIKSQDDLSEMLIQLFLAESYQETFNLADLYHSTYIYDTVSSQLILDLNLKLQNNDDQIQFQAGQLSNSLINTRIVV